MQRLNAREYYVIVLMAIVAMVQAVFLYNEVFSETSPLMTTGDGDLAPVKIDYIIMIGNNFLQVVLAVTAFICLLRKKRAGWIIAISLLSFYAFLLSYILIRAAMAGLADKMFWIGVLLATMLLVAILFLFFPSTIKKFNITKTALIPVVMILGLLSVIYFVIPQ